MDGKRRLWQGKQREPRNNKERFFLQKTSSGTGYYHYDFFFFSVCFVYSFRVNNEQVLRFVFTFIFLNEASFLSVSNISGWPRFPVLVLQPPPPPPPPLFLNTELTSRLKLRLHIRHQNNNILSCAVLSVPTSVFESLAGNVWGEVREVSCLHVDVCASVRVGRETWQMI